MEVDVVKRVDSVCQFHVDLVKKKDFVIVIAKINAVYQTNVLVIAMAQKLCTCLSNTPTSMSF